MRILHITDAVEFSGGVKQLKLLMEGLRNQEGAVAQMLVVPPEGRVADAFEERGFEVHRIPMFQDYDFLAAYRIRKMIRQWKPAIVHAHHPKAHAVTLIARHFCNFSLVVSRRVTHPIKPFPTSRWKYGSRLIDCFLCVSGAVAEELIRKGVHRDKVVIIGSSTDFNRFKPGPPRDGLLKQLGFQDLGQAGDRTGLASHPAVLALIANYSSWKGHDLFLQALHLLKGSFARQDSQRLPYAFLAGRDTEADSLRKRLAVFGLRERVRLLGWRDDVEELLRICDALICPSLSGEGSSGAIREAFAMGVPVIASAIPANRELVDSERGWLFPVGDALGLAQVIADFLRSPESLRRAKTEAAMAYVRENFSAESMVDKTLAVYREIMHKKNAAKDIVGNFR